MVTFHFSSSSILLCSTPCKAEIYRLRFPGFPTFSSLDVASERHKNMNCRRRRESKPFYSQIMALAVAVFFSLQPQLLSCGCSPSATVSITSQEQLPLHSPSDRMEVTALGSYQFLGDSTAHQLKLPSVDSLVVTTVS